MKISMNRISSLQPEFVEFIPKIPRAGVLHVSRKYHTATHLCCCGCGNKVVTPLNPSGWQLRIKNGAVTLRPSIGNWSFRCQSHYWIRGNRVQWAGRLSKRQIDAVRARDYRSQQEYFDAPTMSLWQRF